MSAEASGARWVTTLTEAGILVKIGVSSARLAVCLNILASSADGGVAGAPVHVLLRLLLQHSDTLTEALQLLTNSSLSASSCFTLGSVEQAAPVAFSVEVGPTGTQVVRPAADGWLVHTNHFRVRPSPARDTYGERWPDTYPRLDELEQTLSNWEGVLGVTDLQQLLSSHRNAPLAVCSHGGDTEIYDDRQATLASAILDVGRARRLVADGAPCQATYRDVNRRPRRDAKAGTSLLPTS